MTTRTTTPARTRGARATIGDYDVVVLGNVIRVLRGDAQVTHQIAPGLGRFVAGARELRCGWGRVEGMDVIYLYDQAQGNYGYAVSLEEDWWSDWGFAPYSLAVEGGDS